MGNVMTPQQRRETLRRVADLADQMIRCKMMIEEIRSFLSQENGSKTCSNSDSAGATPAVTADQDSTRDRARTCDLRFSKPKEGKIETTDSVEKIEISSTPADRFTLSTPQTNTDATQTHTDKLLQLEQLKNSRVAYVPGLKVVSLKDSEGRRLIHVTFDNLSGDLPVTLNLGGVRYAYINSIAISLDKLLCAYREISPEEESHLEENRVDTGHDGLLA